MWAEKDYCPVPWVELKVLASAARHAVRRGADPYQAMYEMLWPSEAVLEAIRQTSATSGKMEP